MTASFVSAAFLDRGGVLQRRLETARKIASFLALPTGWNYGHGKPPGRDLVGRVLDLHTLLNALGLRETDAFPGDDGEILLRAYAGDRCAGFLFNPDGSIDLSLEDGDLEEFSKEGVDASDVFSLALKVAAECGTYGSPTPSISIGEKVGSLSWRSKSTPQTMPPQSLMKSVSSEVAATFVLTSGNTTHQVFPEVRQFFGVSETPTFRPVPSSRARFPAPETRATAM